MVKTLTLGSRVRYPITITRLYKRPGDAIRKQETIFSYSYRFRREVPDPETGDLVERELTSVADWESPVDGSLTRWHVQQGDVIPRNQSCLSVEEACSHEVQFQGLCAYCGQDMTQMDWSMEAAETHRATVNMIHDEMGLKVSNTLAARHEFETQRRLLAQRKLSLVVDLDLTIVHACIEPTIGEWKQDPTNPNYEALQDVASFQLPEEGGGTRGAISHCWYYVKCRPGLQAFLQRMSQIYEMHIYTMGTRAYALNIAGIVDPSQKIFGNRVISRDENGNMASKSLERLFPVSTDMVVIIDDRSDVWPRNRNNLVKVTPFDFYKGIGDINSSFLPKRQDILPTETETETIENDTTIDTTVDTTVIETVQPSIETTTGEPIVEEAQTPIAAETKSTTPVDPSPAAKSTTPPPPDAQLQLQSEEQERSLEKQLVERPLLHLQEALEKSDHELETPTAERHHILTDDDHELEFIEQHLRKLHKEFYKRYDSVKEETTSTDQRQPKSRARDTDADQINEMILSRGDLPDIGTVMLDLKAPVFQGLVFVLSGIIPLALPVRQSEIGLQLQSFGATISTKVSAKVTHLILSVNRLRTEKARKARKYKGRIHVVKPEWLWECMRRWERVDEGPFLLDLGWNTQKVEQRQQDGEKAGGEKTGGENLEGWDLSGEGEEDRSGDSDGNESSSENEITTMPRSRPSRSTTIRGKPGTTSLLRRIQTNADAEDDTESLVEDVEHVMPEELPEGQMSPIVDVSIDWDAELAEFLGSDADDDEGDDDDDEDDDEGGDDKEGDEKEKDTSKRRRNGKDDGEEEEEEEEDDGPLLSPHSPATAVGATASFLASGSRKRKSMDEVSVNGGACTTKIAPSEPASSVVEDPSSDSSFAKKQKLAGDKDASQDAAIHQAGKGQEGSNDQEDIIMGHSDHQHDARTDGLADDSLGTGQGPEDVGEEEEERVQQECDNLEADLLAELGDI